MYILNFMDIFTGSWALMGCLEALLGRMCEALEVCEVQGELGRSQNSHWMP